MKRTSGRGQILVGVTLLVLILLILIPLMVQWGSQESKWAVKDQQMTTAFNIAESAVDRGLWKLKSSTGTWAAAVAGTVIPGYNFDVAYTEHPGTKYRVQFSSGPGSKQVTIVAEGMDLRSQQTRAIRAVYSSSSGGGALVSGGGIVYQDHFEVHWGPVYSHGNITLAGWALNNYFPRKFSKQVVVPRDTSGMMPPNTDNLEWWSDYPVPDLPILDFVTMRSSASVNGTLNYYTGEGAVGGSGLCVGWAGHNRCSSAGNNQSAHNGLNHFFDSNHHPLSKSNLIWYWDGNLNLTGTNAGGGCHGMGLYGAVIVRGNLTMDSPEDCYGFINTNVPPDAWKEYQKIDTAGATDYPADAGFHVNNTTYEHGGAGSGWPGGHPDAKTDVGVRGLLYTGGNLTINECSDVAGTVWVVGTTTNNSTGDRVLVFYDPSAIDIVPLLNVVLVRQSWDEISPSSLAW